MINLLNNLKISTTLLLTVLSSTTCLATDVNFEDWHVGVSDDKTNVYASTVNDSNEMIMQLCTFKTKRCTWHVSSSARCNDGASYPVLGNTEEGATHLTVICEGRVGNYYRYVFSSWKDFEALAGKALKLGIAVPLASDRFQVFRFSLRGYAKAKQFQESLFFKGTPSERDTTTITL